MHEVVDRCTFLEKFRVGDDRKFDVDATRLKPLGDRCANKVCRAHRDGRFVYHDRRGSQHVANLLGDLQYIAQIGGAILAWRSSYRDEKHFGLLDRLGKRRGEEQATGLMVLGDDLFEARLIDRQNALLQVIDLGLVDVDAVNPVAHLRDTGSGNQSDVAASNDGDIHSRILDSYIDTGVPRRDPFRWPLAQFFRLGR